MSSQSGKRNENNDSDDAEYDLIMDRIANMNFQRKEKQSTKIVSLKEISDHGLEKVNTPIYQIKIKH